MSMSHRQGLVALPLLTLLGVLIMLATPSVGTAQDATWQFGSTSSFSSGTYGTGTSTDVLYTPVIARRLFRDGDLTFVFPFTCIWGDGSVTLVNGSATPQQRPAATGATADRGTRTTATTSTSATNAGPQRNCGMGDIVVRGRYFAVDEHGWVPTIAVRAHVKTPTASAERELGTGRPDEGFGIEVSRTSAGGSTFMVDGGYTFIGKPAGVVYKNNWWYDVGIAQDLAKGALNLSVFFDEDRTIVPGFENARDILAALSVKGGRGWRLQISGELGLSDGAPDHGVTFGASRRF